MAIVSLEADLVAFSNLQGTLGRIIGLRAVFNPTSGISVSSAPRVKATEEFVVDTSDPELVLDGKEEPIE